MTGFEIDTAICYRFMHVFLLFSELCDPVRMRCDLLTCKSPHVSGDTWRFTVPVASDLQVGRGCRILAAVWHYESTKLHSVSITYCSLTSIFCSCPIGIMPPPPWIRAGLTIREPHTNVRRGPFSHTPTQDFLTWFFFSRGALFFSQKSRRLIFFSHRRYV